MIGLLGLGVLGAAATLMATKPSCATDAERKQADIDCRIGSIKGLGASYSTGKFQGLDPCVVKTLPLCMTTVLPALRSTHAPSTPLPPSTTKIERPTLQPMPTFPSKVMPTTTVAQVPVVVPSTAPNPPLYQQVPSPPTPTPTPPVKQMSMATMGLIAAVVVGGGYLAYRAYKGK